MTVTYRNDNASLIMAALDCAASNYQRMATDPNLPPPLASLFDEYAERLTKMSEDVQFASFVTFSDE